MPIPAGSGAPPALPSGPLYYDPQLSRVRLTATGLADGVPVTVQRSTDGIRWSTVRGGTVTPAGGQIRVSDYEFGAGVANQYRVMAPGVIEVFGSPVTGGWGAPWVTSGGAGSDYNVASGVGTQLLNSVNVLRTALRDVGVTDGTVQADVTVPVTPTGAPITVWLPARATGASNYYTARLGIDTTGAATLSISSRVAGTLTSLTSLVTVGTHAPAVPWRIVFDPRGSVLRAKAWQQGEDPGWQVSVTDTALTSGTQAGVLTRLETGNTNGTVTVSVDNFLLTDPAVAVYSGSIVPVIDRVWLKSVARPFLNRPVTVVDYSDVERPARGGTFDVVGRSLPVSVSDVRGSRRWTLEVLADTPDEADGLELLFAGGDTLFVHVPAGEDVPGGFVEVGDIARRRTSRLGPRRVLELPCTAVAAPGPDVVGATVTCQSVLTAYPTVQAMLDAHDTIVSLLELVGDPTDVIVP